MIENSSATGASGGTWGNGNSNGRIYFTREEFDAEIARLRAQAILEEEPEDAPGHSEQPGEAGGTGDGEAESESDGEQAEERPPHPVQALINALAVYPAEQRGAAIDAARALVAPLAEAVRATLNLRALFRTQAELERFLKDLPTPGSRVFERIGYKALLEMPPKEWLITGLIGRGDAIVFSGPPASGKTWLIIDLIHAACTGNQFGGQFTVTRPLNILYCTDEGTDGLGSRFRGAGAFWGVSSLPNFQFSPTVPQFGAKRAGGEDGINALCREWMQDEAAGLVAPLDLLIVDTFQNATQGVDENSATEVNEVFAAAKRAARRLGCAVLFVHHTGKDGAGYRGSSAIEGNSNLMAYIKPAGGKFGFSLHKLKDGQKWRPATFSLVAVGDADSLRVWWDEASDADGESESGTFTGARAEAAIMQVLREQAGKWLTAKRLAEAVGKQPNQVNNILNTLMRKGQPIERRLEKPDATESNRNPWVYTLAGEAEGEARGKASGVA